MKKLLFQYNCTLIACFFVFNAASQTKLDVAFGRVKTVLNQGSVCRVGVNKLYLNKAESIFDINDYQIPLHKARFTFKYDNISQDCTSYYVQITCENDNCIITKGGEVSGLAIPLVSKDKCYEFINAISDLKQALK